MRAGYDVWHTGLHPARGQGDHTPYRGDPMPTRRRLDWDLIRVVAEFAVLLGHVPQLGPVLHPELGAQPYVVAPQFGAAALLIVPAYLPWLTMLRGHPRR